MKQKAIIRTFLHSTYIFQAPHLTSASVLGTESIGSLIFMLPLADSSISSATTQWAHTPVGAAVGAVGPQRTEPAARSVPGQRAGSSPGVLVLSSQRKNRTHSVAFLQLNHSLNKHHRCVGSGPRREVRVPGIPVRHRRSQRGGAQRLLGKRWRAALIVPTTAITVPSLTSPSSCPSCPSPVTLTILPSSSSALMILWVSL